MKKLSGVFVASLIATVVLARAADSPSRPITVVVPYAAGGAMDAVGRIVAQSLQEKFAVPAIVDNRVGANGLIGMRYVAKAAPDGTTLMISSETGQAILPTIDPSFPLDTLNTFTPISLVGTFPHFLVARRSLGVKTVADFVARAKANPGKLNFGSNGVGTIAHVGMELLKTKAGVDIANIPYRGSPAALFDLMAGTVDANIQSLPVLAGQFDNPSLQILAILSDKRDPRFPDVPTMVESGFPDLVFVSWTAVFGPPAMPSGAVAALSNALSAAAKSSEVAEQLRNVGFEAVGSDAATLDVFQRSVAAKWKAIARETDITMKP